MHRLFLITIVLLSFAGSPDAVIAQSGRNAQSSLNHRGQRTAVITLQRTVCYGTCPEYKLTIFADGRVLYEGISYVKKEGKAWGRITRRQLETLILEFNKINYFSLADSYTPGTKVCPQSMTDMPAATTSLTRNGKSKTIVHYHGCRGLSVMDQLTQLENKIDEVVNVNKWVK